MRLRGVDCRLGVARPENGGAGQMSAAGWVRLDCHRHEQGHGRGRQRIFTALFVNASHDALRVRAALLLRGQWTHRRAIARSPARRRHDPRADGRRRHDRSTAGQVGPFLGQPEPHLATLGGSRNARQDPVHPYRPARGQDPRSDDLGPLLVRVEENEEPLLLVRGCLRVLRGAYPGSAPSYALPRDSPAPSQESS